MRLDVNAIVSFNVKAIRERRGMTQIQVAERLAQLTGNLLPQASISAMERGFDGERRRRFDAHELYLLSHVFGVPIAYFFLPPPGHRRRAGRHPPARPATCTCRCSGQDWQLDDLDDRLRELKLDQPRGGHRSPGRAVRRAASTRTIGTSTSGPGAGVASRRWPSTGPTASTRSPSSSSRSARRSESSAPRATSSRTRSRKATTRTPAWRRTRGTDAWIGDPPGRRLLREDRARPRSGDGQAPHQVALRVPDQAGGRAGPHRPAVEGRPRASTSSRRRRRSPSSSRSGWCRSGRR